MKSRSDDWKTISVVPAIYGLLFQSGKDKATKVSGILD